MQANNKKRILYVHHAHVRGGAPRSLSFLLDCIDQSKYDIAYMCMCDEEGNRKMFLRYTDEFYFVQGCTPFHGSTVCRPTTLVELLRQIKRVPGTIRCASQYIRKAKPDIVHLNSTCLWPVAWAVKRVSKKIKVICHIREPLVKKLSGRIINMFVSRFVDGFVAIDEFDSRSVKTGKKPIRVIYNSVDFELYNSNIKSDKLREELGLEHDDLIYLYMARISPTNGPLEMLRYIEPIIKENKKIHFCIVGWDQGGMDEYRRGILDYAEKFKDNVHVLSFRTDVNEVIASSDVMIVPFQTPHFSRSIIEAAAMGVPSIASDIGGPQELVVDGKTGFLFDPKTFDGFKEQCLMLVDDEKRTSMGRAAEAFARENFDAIKNAEKVFDFYETICRGDK